MSGETKDEAKREMLVGHKDENWFASGNLGRDLQSEVLARGAMRHSVMQEG